ncbi:MULTISPECIES: aldo/keto reductase [unclassified Brenneria]|uniref:aldo/keto reductase n=1 Tax=unclassified Brenneria TaxID=2634434 RepID=UPI001553B742|nr:aldo/keto reductase [Brenneria sp. hezel4-2-4]MEE3652964.1 aldo/keto reductase [Brenneria sp. HEZEL_4_2_4]NPD02918.1 aldo/keto reductase [Brenneria sp. hezel4-2-4]
MPASESVRELGRSGIKVPLLTFGGNVFGWTIDQPASFSILDALLEHRLNFIDTADVYSTWVPGNKGGESETIIGNWLKKTGRRDKVIIATKVGKDMGDNKKGLSARYIRQAVEASLQRLQTDYIDLYQSHDDDKETPLEETLATFDALIKEGKVRAIGASNYDAPRLAQALKVSADNHLARYETLQPEYNLYDRQGYEAELEPLAREQGLGVINYYSLASGFLSGKYRQPADASKSARGQGVVKQYLNERGKTILEALDSIANIHQATQSQVALAWLIARPGITAPIASATSLEQVNQLADATRLILPPEDIELLNKASAY